MQRVSGLPEATWPLNGGIGIGSQVVKPESFKLTVLSWDLCSHFSDEENETQGGQRLPPGNTGQGWDEAETQSSGPTVGSFASWGRARTSHSSGTGDIKHPGREEPSSLCPITGCRLKNLSLVSRGNLFLLWKPHFSPFLSPFFPFPLPYPHLPPRALHKLISRHPRLQLGQSEPDSLA